MHKNMRWGKLIFLCIVLLVAFFVGQRRIQQRIEDLNYEETVLRMELSDLRQEEAELNRQIDMVGTDVYVINMARSDEYNYVKPGELRFEYVNPQALATYTEEQRLLLEREMAID